MLLPLLLAAATLASPDRGLRYSNDGDEASSITQLNLAPFLLKLEPTPTLFGGSDKMETYVQTVIEDYVSSRTSGLDYVLLAGIGSVDWDSGEDRRNRNLQATLPSTTMKINGGVVSFSEPVAEDYNVNTAAKEAIDSKLVTFLRDTEFRGISSVTYITTTEAPTGAPADERDTVVVAPVQRISNDYEKEAPKTRAVLFSLLGVAFVALASVLLIRKHNQVHAMLELDPEDKPSQVDDHDDAATEVDDAEGQECASQQAHYHDAASTDQGSVVSEWTLTSRDTSTGLRTNDMLVHSETFDRDRQVSLRKDLMLSPWSGTQQPSMPLPPRAQGRHDFASWRTEQGDVDSDSPFRFEQAHAAQGEEVYFMPASRARNSNEANEKLALHGAI
jgi:hypothetical protein